MSSRRSLALLLSGLAVLAGTPLAQGSSTADADCSERAATACLRTLALPHDAGRLSYYASRPPEAASSGTKATGVTSALLVLHGHSRDANGSFNAGLKAARQADRLDQTLVVAPIFQVDPARARKCSSRGVPEAQPGDATWTCGGWLAGTLSSGDRDTITSFAALDALIGELKRQWPSLRTITLAGFSAGAQMLQRSILFAGEPPAGVSLRYVIASPGTWLYLDDLRPTPMRHGGQADWSDCNGSTSCEFDFKPPPADARCKGYNRWKYGLETLPAYLQAQTAPATALRERYRRADIAYAEGELDNDDARRASYGVLDTSCAAMLQGPFRLQRGLAFHAYDRAVIHPAKPRTMTIVPGCAHSATCVFPAEPMRRLLFP